MRLIESNTKAVYEVPDWFAKKNGFGAYRKMTIIRNGPASHLMQFSEDQEVWVPMSLCRKIELVENLAVFGIGGSQ